MNSSVLEIVIKARDEASAQMRGIQGSLKSMEGSFTALRNVGIGAFVGIGAVAVTTFKAFAEGEAQTALTNKSLENSFNKLGGQTGLLSKDLGATSSALETLKSRAQEAGKAALRLGFDDEEAAASFAKLYTATGSTAEATKQLALAQDIARMKGVGLEEATSALMKAHNGSSKVLVDLIGDVKGATTVTEIFAEATKQAGGAAQTFAEQNAGKIEIMNKQFEELQQNIGGSLAPAIGKLIAMITPLIEKFAGWIEANSDLAGKILLAGLALAGIAIAIGSVGLVLPAIIAGVGFLTTAMGALGTVLTFLAASPIVLIVAAIAALVAGIIWCIYNWDLVSAKIQEVFNIIEPYIAKMVTLIIETVKRFAIGVYSMIVNAFTAVKETVISIWDSIKNTINGVIDTIMSKIQAMVDAIKSAYSSATSFIGGSVSSLFGGKRANGGPVSGGNSYLVGENGPEMFTPNSTGAVIPNTGMGTGITININGNTFLSDDQAVVDKIGNAIMRTLQFQLKI